MKEHVFLSNNQDGIVEEWLLDNSFLEYHKRVKK